MKSMGGGWEGQEEAQQGSLWEGIESRVGTQLFYTPASRIVHCEPRQHTEMAFGHRGHDGSLWSVLVGGSTLSGLSKGVTLDSLEVRHHRWKRTTCGLSEGRLTFVKKDPGLGRDSPPGHTSH